MVFVFIRSQIGGARANVLAKLSVHLILKFCLIFLKFLRIILLLSVFAVFHEFLDIRLTLSFHVVVYKSPKRGPVLKNILSLLKVII